MSPGQGGGLCHLVNMAMAMPTKRGNRRNRGRPTPVGYGEARPTFLDVLEREAKGRRQRRVHRPSRESRLPLGKTWETPASTGAGSSTTNGCLRTCSSNRTDCPRGTSSGAGSRPGGFGLAGASKTRALGTIGHRLAQNLLPPNLTWPCPINCAGPAPGTILTAAGTSAWPPKVLVVDEFGIRPYDRESATAFFTLVSARYERGSIMLTSNKGFGEWGELLGDSVITSAVLDRLLHHRHVLNVPGGTWRLRDKRQASLFPSLQHVGTGLAGASGNYRALQKR